jgi:uncharacterized protein (TIGR00266 family)
MEFIIQGRGLYASVLARLNPGEKFISEAGAMYRASSNVDIDVTTHSSGGSGGFFAAVKRLFAGESFFFSTYTITDGKPGEVGLAPTHAGETRLITLDGSKAWLCAGGSFLAATDAIKVDTQFQGMKGFFSGESISFIKASGVGQIVVEAFGRISEIDVTEDLTVDTGHVVAFEESLTYKITKAGGSWFHSWLAGEGLVFQFTGRGRILVQSHNPKEFGSELGALLPERS